MSSSFWAAVSSLVGAACLFASLVTFWVGGNTIAAGTLSGGTTLIIVGLLLMMAAVFAVPPSRRWLQTRLDTEFSASTILLLGGSAVALAVGILFIALIALLASW